MKKKNFLIFILTFLFALMISGCDQTSLDTKTTKENVETTSSFTTKEIISTTTNEEDNQNETEEITTPSEDDEDDKVLTVEEAIALARRAGEVGTTEKVLVKGEVSRITNYSYGEMYITDGTNELYIYGTRSADGEIYYDSLDDKPQVGDTVVLLGIVHTYNDNPEMKVGWIQSFTHVEKEIDLDEYTEYTLDEAIELAEGTKVKVTGTVKQITYTQGYNANGFIMVDNFASIYVYGNAITSQVKVGETVTIVGERTNFIADSEKSYAEKWNYTGSVQIQNCELVEKKNITGYKMERWAEETTVKELMDLPFNTDKTTLIYKVKGLVIKAINPGYVNYYIDDLDGHTGSYVYTSNNGKDFEWLDEFDQKVCTIYMMLINAKSQSSGCIWRLLPVQVEYDEEWSFDQTKVPKFILDYYVDGLFDAEYQGDPALEVPTVIDNEYIGAQGATIEYVSSNADAIKFEETEGKLLMHTGTEHGTSTITVTATLGNNTLSRTYEVKYASADNFETITVKEAIEAERYTEVTVRGIVASSLTLQSGFVIIDKTGAISVMLDAEQCKTIAIGDEVVVKGTRNQFKDDPEKNQPGHSIIDGGELLANLHGNNAIPQDSFKDETIAHLTEFDYTVDSTTQAYKVRCRVSIYKTQYSSTVDLYDIDEDVYLAIYSSGIGSLKWLTSVACDEDGNSLGEVELTLLLCNWNNKTYYKCIAMSVTVDGVTYYNTANFS